MGRRNREAVRREYPLGWLAEPAGPFVTRLEPGVRSSGPATPKGGLGLRMEKVNEGKVRQFRKGLRRRKPNGGGSGG